MYGLLKRVKDSMEYYATRLYDGEYVNHILQKDPYFYWRPLHIVTRTDYSNSKPVKLVLRELV